MNKIIKIFRFGFAILTCILNHLGRFLLLDSKFTLKLLFAVNNFKKDSN